jgi:hypothetical protein
VRFDWVRRARWLKLHGQKKVEVDAITSAEIASADCAEPATVEV